MERSSTTGYDARGNAEMGLSDYNFTVDEERDEVRRQFAECHSILRGKAFDADDAESPLFCQLHDAFPNRAANHNCLGCNLADSVELIEAFLRTHPLMERVRHAYTQHILLNYLIVERMETLFEIISLNELYRLEHFKILVEVRRWANFIKHPKAFILTHHAEFTFAGSPKVAELERHASEKIDRSFVETFYKDGGKDKDLSKRLQNKEDVLVIFPNAVQLTENMCSAFRECVDLVTRNKVYSWVLNQRSTFLDYWADEAVD